MKKQIERVALFHNRFKIENAAQPTASLSKEDMELRHRLMEEENNEYLDACKAENLVEVADALGDMMYILSGTILKHGLENHIEYIFDEIQRSNLSKLQGDGTPKLRADGKILKGEHYFKPNIKRILNRPFILRVLPFNFEQKKEREAAFAIRKEVFVEEQNVDAREEYDGFEASSQHYLAFADEEAVGTARWRMVKDGTKIKLERFAILKAYRGHGIGLDLVQHLLDDVKAYNLPVYLHAQEQVVDFYEKLGFRKTSDRFMEAGIGHYKMEWLIR